VTSIFRYTDVNLPQTIGTSMMRARLPLTERLKISPEAAVRS
jgi:hypothetical protein